ncbi:MAG: hypothetical protein FWF57_01440 [Defluviitaleaceae bacterium]|nr:hypothetical protein [Defluviitaleaceae bacterium]
MHFKKAINKISAKVVITALAFLLVMIFKIIFSALPVLASAPSAPAGFGQFGTGVMNLINDFNLFVIAAGPVIAGLGLAYFALKKSIADEQDYKSLDKKMRTSVICGIIILTAGVIMNIATAYFGV